ncbi:hypothetical protein AQJ58_25935 [Streptomyces sp. DSM 15324]|nr:hypothetical protein AQJ58_25935 [Streptomyces sp. DSM 15324]
MPELTRSRDKDRVGELFQKSRALYGLGSALRSVGEPGMGARAVDVHARAAQALSGLDNGVSAVLESDQAVAAHLELGADAVGHPLFLGLARVRTLNALVLFDHGRRPGGPFGRPGRARACLSRSDEINAGSFEEVALSPPGERPDAATRRRLRVPSRYGNGSAVRRLRGVCRGGMLEGAHVPVSLRCAARSP